MQYQEIKGDLIKLAKAAAFDIVAHGCNCHSTMGAGIAVQMAKAFGADKFEMESYVGIEKLGCIDWQTFVLGKSAIWNLNNADNKLNEPELVVVNAYTQFNYGQRGGVPPLDYEALTCCMRKINHIFKGKHIGLPQIGAGLAGGYWGKIKQIIQTELKDMTVTVVIYNQ